MEEESLPAEAPTRETTDTSVSIAPPVQEHNNPDAVTADDLVGPWHLVEDEKDNATAMEAIPGAMEFGSSMEITSDGHISWYIGADGSIGTGAVLRRLPYFVPAPLSFGFSLLPSFWIGKAMAGGNLLCLLLSIAAGGCWITVLWVRAFKLCE